MRSRAVNHPYFPLVLILIANLIVGLFTFQDYGTSWDEPLFYAYGEAVPYAYSVSARLSGNFDIEQAYGPSAEDHKIYGPIYLLLAKPLVDLLDWMLPIPRADLWHLVNFLFFQVGVVLFFALCRRWMNSWAAFGATLLYSTQPLIWGHSWINPKDIPFTVFFLATVYFGFKMVDALTEASSVPDQHEPVDISTNRWRRWRTILQVLAIFFVLITLACFVLYNQIQGLLTDLIHNAYTAPSGSLLATIFSKLATNMQSVPEDAYINKGLVLFNRIRSLITILCLIFLIPALLYTFWGRFVQRFYLWSAKIFGPLPDKPSWGWNRLSDSHVIVYVVLSGIFLGMLISIRVIGPLAGALVCLYFLLKPGQRAFAGMVIYGIIAIITIYVVWPYLWDAPIARFIKVFQHMSHNPQIGYVLFNGVVIRTDKLPITYLPVLMGITLTWAVWPLFIAGMLVLWSRIKSQTIEWRSIIPIVLWFFIPFVYVLVVRPPMYDGYRHFLFILPPVFILGGLAIQAIWDRVNKKAGFAIILAVLIAPGIIGLVMLHPYEYTYYNQLVGNTGGAFRRFETDYWLTCYKELMAKVDEEPAFRTTLFVHRNPAIAKQYATPGMNIDLFDPDDDRTFPGSWLLLTTRANVDLSIHPEAPEILSVGREGAKFCLVKDIP
jgi:hypothetical protein